MVYTVRTNWILYRRWLNQSLDSGKQSIIFKSIRQILIKKLSNSLMVRILYSIKSALTSQTVMYGQLWIFQLLKSRDPGLSHSTHQSTKSSTSETETIYSALIRWIVAIFKKYEVKQMNFLRKWYMINIWKHSLIKNGIKPLKVR